MKEIYLENISEDKDKKEIIKWLLEDNKLNVEIFYKSNFLVTKNLRDFIEVSGNIFWISEKMIARIILISDELNNNAIEHWSSEDAINKLRLKIEKIDWKIILNLEVEDNWKWKDPKTALDMETLRAHKLKLWYKEHDSIRWRWLFLITVQIADRLYFKNSKEGWLIVWIKKELDLKDPTWCFCPKTNK